ncbi:MAG: hypothetical protein U0V87_03775 [Acidobacteriota bacterium]
MAKKQIAAAEDLNLMNIVNRQFDKAAEHLNYPPGLLSRSRSATQRLLRSVPGEVRQRIPDARRLGAAEQATA